MAGWCELGQDRCACIICFGGDQLLNVEQIIARRRRAGEVTLGLEGKGGGHLCAAHFEHPSGFHESRGRAQRCVSEIYVDVVMHV